MKYFQRCLLSCLLAGAMLLTGACGEGAGASGNGNHDALSMEAVYQMAVEKGYTGTLEELIEAFRGEQGPKGETGATGPKGDTGDAGLSAYQIYCKYHPNYTGTEEEWLNEFLSGAAARKHEVTFNTFGGSPVPAQSVPHGDKAEQPENPSKPGYTFVKWLTEGREWVFYGYSVTEDMNFDAQWKITNEPAVLIEAQAFSNYALAHVTKRDPYGLAHITKITYRAKSGGNCVGDAVEIPGTDQDKRTYRVEGLTSGFVYEFAVHYEYDANGDGTRETNTSSGSTAFPNYACPDITVGNANVTDGVVSFEIEMRGSPTAVKNFNLYLQKGNTTVETLTLASALVKEGNVYRVSGEFSATIENPADYYVRISCDYEWYTGYITASDWFTYTIFLD